MSEPRIKSIFGLRGLDTVLQRTNGELLARPPLQEGIMAARYRVLLFSNRDLLGY